MDPNEFVLLTKSYDTNESHFITGLLESHGIETVTDRRPAGHLTGFGEDLIPDIKIYVKRSDVTDASSILNYQEPVTDEDFKRRHKKAGEGKKYDKQLGMVYLLISAFIFFLWHSFTPNTEGQLFYKYILLGLAIVPAYIAFTYLTRAG